METIDLEMQKLLIDIYSQLKNNDEISIGAPNYEQSQIDYLVEQKLIKSIDASTLDRWGYIVRETYLGKKYVESLQDTLHYRICKFIERGEEIETKEKHDAMGIITISGPLYNAWMDEINVFTERYLKEHPLYNSIHTTYFHRKNMHSYSDMMGHLNALSKDDELGKTTAISIPKQIKTYNSFEEMLKTDIERCEMFLGNPESEEIGINLYIDITGKYDAIIPNLGYGLYQYIDEYHFYDPEISGESLKQNLQRIVAKMKSFQMTNGYNLPKKDSLAKTQEGRIQMSNKVFIVHGHDELAVQEMARTLEKWGFEAIILHEQADLGLTIIEKIERYTDVDFAVVLYTECDYGRAKEVDVSEEKFRARQNVVFEHGYLISRLGREHVCALVKGDVETPGDISGVVYVSMDKNGAWKMALAKNMKAAGINIDMDKFLG